MIVPDGGESMDMNERDGYRGMGYNGERQWDRAHAVSVSSLRVSCIHASLIIWQRAQEYIVFWYCGGYFCESQRSIPTARSSTALENLHLRKNPP